MDVAACNLGGQRGFTALIDGWSRCRHQIQDPSWARLKRRRRLAMTAQSTVLHVPSLAAAVTGDLAYNQVHMMTAEDTEPERAQCPRRRDLHRPSSHDPDLSRHILTNVAAALKQCILN
jgi:hypothetical protein